MKEYATKGRCVSFSNAIFIINILPGGADESNDNKTWRWFRTQPTRTGPRLHVNFDPFSFC